MKILTTAFLLLLSIFLASAQNDCRAYVPTEKGAKWEITNYTAKGKEDGRTAFELVDKEVSGKDVIFTIKSTSFDKKDQEVFSNTFEAKCIDGKFEFDMAYKMDGNALKAYQNMNVEIDASEYEMPDSNQAPGTELKDGELTVAIDAGVKMNMTVFITDRKIESKEQIETPAGKFDCVVLSQNVSTKLLLKVEASSKEWYAENIGMVRSESYNKKGKLMGYSELTKLEQ